MLKRVVVVMPTLGTPIRRGSILLQEKSSLPELRALVESDEELPKCKVASVRKFVSSGPTVMEHLSSCQAPKEPFNPPDSR